MDIIYWIAALWVIVGFIVSMLFGFLSDSDQHGDSMIRVALREKLGHTAKHRG